MQVAATLQCGGNRRGGMNSVAKTSGTAWGCGAISTAQWTGVSVRDVLTAAGLKDPDAAGVAHVSFHAADDMCASVPVEKVFNPYGDVLLAWDMNGAPIPADHGAPLRAVVPGHVGVRNVKWVTRLEAGAQEAEGMWQRGTTPRPSACTCVRVWCVYACAQPLSCAEGHVRQRGGLASLPSSLDCEW
jgi:sulfite oxidase